MKRNVPLKALSEGEVHPAAKGHVRQAVTVMTGIAEEKTKEISKFVKSSGVKVQTQIQGDQVRVLGQEQGRPAEGHRGGQGARLRHRAAVHELPAL